MYTTVAMSWNLFYGYPICCKLSGNHCTYAVLHYLRSTFSYLINIYLDYLYSLNLEIALLVTVSN